MFLTGGFRHPGWKNGPAIIISQFERKLINHASNILKED
ncbi:hypothetical protein D1AOALGA4SA_8001 [Olavius algarvensis Delta 1 endosymbiont]|nr:hypothetical protein D1AOALGA4SA_8001 [Olavius algarvensis Delta 1 endosymbiont]